MSDAYKRGIPRDEQGGGYPLLRAEFYIAQASSVPSPVHEMNTVAPAEEEARLLDESGQLFNEPEFSGWALADEYVKVHQARFRDAQDTTIVISKEAMTDRLTAIIDQAFDELLATDARALYAARLGEMALWYSLAQRPRPASLAYAAHRALADPQRDLKPVSFLRALLFRSFLHLMPRGGEGGEEKAPDPTSLIVRPD
jgi:hypothetical protein